MSKILAVASSSPQSLQALQLERAQAPLGSTSSGPCRVPADGWPIDTSPTRPSGGRCCALHRKLLGPSHGTLNASRHDGTKRGKPRFNGRRKDISRSPGNAPGPSPSASQPSRSRAAPTASSAQPPAAAQPLPARQIRRRWRPLRGLDRPQGEHRTLGLDRPQGEQSARSGACPSRASQCRHQQVRK